MTTLRWGTATDVGAVRESNQDSLLASEPLFAVADGMGGHRGGEVASATALEVLDQTFAFGKTKEELLEAVRKANAKVWDKAQLDEHLHGMGTTLTAAALISDEEDSDHEVLAVINIGDSRTYRMRGDQIEQLTTDHSFVEEMVRAGELSPEEAESHPKRNIVTRALGVEPTVECDLDLVEFEQGDRILLCSDGLTRELNDGQVAAVLRRLKDPTEAARELVKQAKEHGGHDNITVVIVDVVDDGSEPVHIATPAKQQSGKASKVKTPKTPRPTRLTFRVVTYVTAVIALLIIAAGSVVWYARASYYVGLEGEQVTIYRGRPEPVLWFKPTIAERTNVSVSQILPGDIPKVRAGASQSSLENAQAFVRNLSTAYTQAQQAGQTPTAPAP